MLLHVLFLFYFLAFSHFLIFMEHSFDCMVKKISANIGAIDVGAFGVMFDGIGGPINPSIH
jgi:hypothetical protein